MKRKNNALYVLLVSIAYAAWGILTIFWNLLSEVSPVYILAHRVIWSAVFMGLYALLRRQGREISGIFHSGKMLARCFLCGVLVTVNWGVYIYAVNTGHVLDASLGYFIEPVFVGLIGILAFREKPSRLEWVTFGFALAALLYMLIASGVMPLLAVLIAGSFAVYGGVKKKLDITPEVALFMETLCMTPFAMIFVVWQEVQGRGALGILAGPKLLLLAACGLVTSIPLLLFNTGVKHIPYYFSGILMYINPTLQFLMGLFYFHETLDKTRLVAFIIIWVGVLFTLYDKLRKMRQEKLDIPRQK